MSPLRWRTYTWPGQLSPEAERDVRRMCAISGGELVLSFPRQSVRLEGLAGPRLRGLIAYLDRALPSGHR